MANEKKQSPKITKQGVMWDVPPSDPTKQKAEVQGTKTVQEYQPSGTGDPTVERNEQADKSGEKKKKSGKSSLEAM